MKWQSQKETTERGLNISIDSYGESHAPVPEAHVPDVHTPSIELNVPNVPIRKFLITKLKEICWSQKETTKSELDVPTDACEEPDVSVTDVHAPVMTLDGPLVKFLAMPNVPDADAYAPVHPAKPGGSSGGSPCSFAPTVKTSERSSVCLQVSDASTAEPVTYSAKSSLLLTDCLALGLMHPDIQLFQERIEFLYLLSVGLLQSVPVEYPLPADKPADVAPEGHVSPETEQVSSPGSASSTHLEEHDEEDFDDDDDDDDDDAAAAAIDTQIQASDHEEVPIETVLPPKRPANTTYDAIVASEGKIVEAENRRHSDLMTVLERMIALQEETVSQLAHLHRVFIEVPKQLQKINTSFEALVVQQTQANYWRMTNVPQFNTSQPGSVHAGQFSPHSSDIHSPGPNVTGQVADIAVQVPDDILPLPSVQIQQQTPTKEATKTKQDTHETDQPSLVQCLPTCSHVSVGTSPVREQSLPKSPVGESLPKSPVGESLPKSPVGESLPKSPVGESLPKSPVGESLPKSPVGESLPKSPVGESLPKSPVGESLATSPVG
ncbi:uncharacterized protein LOC142491899 [Ascaphus truei]|uniref:uncharacterized protein LOC142491899 n=1 Tax=Ascaphus truei TaxID=8439 RepID=UPI003F592AC1